MSKSRTRKPLIILSIVLAAFAFGAVSAEKNLFPYSVVRAVASKIAGLFSGAATGDEPPGFWEKREGDTRGDPELDQQTISELANNPYLRGTKSAPEVESVTVYDPEAAFDGLNLVVSGHAAAAFLQDMKGNTLHEWRCEKQAVWPGPIEFEEWGVHETFWRRAHVYPNGDLLAVFEGIGMIKLDADSNLIWAYQGRCHHDIFVDERGYIYTLARRKRDEHDTLRLRAPILEDFIVVLTPDGEEHKQVSVLSALVNSDYYSTLALAAKRGDMLHTNTVEVMDGRFGERHPLYAAGNVLVSIPTLNEIAVIDLEAEKVIWTLGGLWMFQHQPTVLDNGNMLVFDNLGQYGKSKVVEIEPLTQKIVWSYRSSEANEFSSYVIGSCQRLPNGNTLVTESTTGRAFEVTREGDIAWEFLNPARAGDDNELIACLLEVVRIERGYFNEEFSSAQNDYATGRRRFDLSELEALIDQLK